MSRKIPVMPMIDAPSLDEIAERLNFEIPTSFDGAPVTGQKKKATPGREMGFKAGDLTFRRRTERRRMLDLSKVKAAADQLAPLPGEEETIHAVLGGDFHAWDVVPAIHRMLSRSIDALTIATLGFNLANNAQLCEMLDAGDIKAAAVLCSHYFKNADPDVYNVAEERLRARGQRIGAARNHAKLILIEAGPARYVVESSANLRSCNNFEQLTLTRSRKLYDFHRVWILRVLKSVGA